MEKNNLKNEIYKINRFQPKNTHKKDAKRIRNPRFEASILTLHTAKS